MGYYVEVPKRTGKQAQIIAMFGGTACTYDEALKEVRSGTKAVIVIVDNAYLDFEAAAYAYDLREFEAFHDPSDHRRHDYVLLDKDMANNLTGYKG